MRPEKVGIEKGLERAIGDTDVYSYNTFIDLADATQLLFFFQAEDGIPDGHVTGVQTCALPIARLAVARGYAMGGMVALLGVGTAAAQDRSEERRVGKSVDLGGRRNIKNKT